MRLSTAQARPSQSRGAAWSRSDKAPESGINAAHVALAARPAVPIAASSAWPTHRRSCEVRASSVASIAHFDACAPLVFPCLAAARELGLQVAQQGRIKRKSSWSSFRLAARRTSRGLGNSFPADLHPAGKISSHGQRAVRANLDTKTQPHPCCKLALSLPSPCSAASPSPNPPICPSASPLAMSVPPTPSCGPAPPRRAL